MEIRKTEKIFIVSFDTHGNRFVSDYERNKFYRELHGWKQIVCYGGKRYCYRRQGLLDNIPHIRIADSVFAIAAEHIKQIEEFFENWQKRVEYEIFEMLMSRKQFLNALRSKGEMNGNRKTGN
jgi:hypothetical protein